MYQTAAPAATANPVITPLMKPIGSSPSIAGPTIPSRAAPSRTDECTARRPESVQADRRVRQPRRDVGRERRPDEHPEGRLHGRPDGHDDDVRPRQQGLGAHPGLESALVEVDRAAEREQLARTRPADRQRRPIGGYVHDGAAPLRRSPRGSRRSRSGPVPGSPTISHSSGPSHSTWRVPSSDDDRAVRLGRRAGADDFGSAASSGRRRRDRPAGRPARGMAARGRAPAARRLRGANARGVPAPSRDGLPIASAFSGSNTTDRRSPPRRSPSTSGASTRSPIRSRPPLTSASANVRPRAALRYDDVTWPSIGTGGAPRSASGATSWAPSGRTRVRVDRQQADELLAVRPQRRRAADASAGR